MDEHFVSHKIGVLLKKNQFYGTCFARYYRSEIYEQLGHWSNATKDKNQTAAPIYQQVIDFFDYHDIYIEIVYNFDKKEKVNWIYRIHTKDNFCKIDNGKEFKTRYLAMNSAFLESFKLLNSGRK